MNKAELTNRLAKETGMPLSTTKMFLETFREVVEKSIEEQEYIDFFGVFKIDFVKSNRPWVSRPAVNMCDCWIYYHTRLHIVEPPRLTFM